ncbi:MAG: hypothetical protein HN868_18310 [Gammaproteobacteria bacterium]|jgi:hypothetical protein|nr:hypothetical protein [Gammaproteobacteria bacterium]MBT7209307.1 hypothetical protein [Gammaproteobacteria bacterium]
MSIFTNNTCSTNGISESENHNYVNNLAEGVIFSQGVDPTGNNLIALFGNGHESNNRQAITYWVGHTLNESQNYPASPLPTLNQNFKDLISEVIDIYS